jgi:hypothetical protein
VRTLLLDQWRRVRISFAVFTLAGALLPPYFATTRVHWTAVPSGVSPWTALLAAALAARLFARSAAGHDSPYWANLPIPRNRWTVLRFAVLFTLLALSLGVQWLAWHSPLATGIFDAAYWPDANADLADTTFVTGPHGDLHAAFLPPDLLLTLAFALLVAAATSYFASSFERASAAWQAGLPGFCFALVALGLLTDDCWIMHPARLGSATALLLAVSTGCAFLLQRERGTCAGDRKERLLGLSAPRSTATHLLGQVLFVVMPWVLLATSDSEVSPAPALTHTELFWLWISLLSICVLPGTLREARILGRSASAAIGIGLLRTSLVGLPVWKVLRRRSPCVHCAECGRHRLARLDSCPDCGAHGTRAISQTFTRRALVPDEPWGIAIVTTAVVMLSALLLSWIPRTQTREWKIVADLPGVEFARVGSKVRSRSLSGSLNPSESADMPEFGRYRDGTAVPHSSPFTASDLRTAAADDVHTMGFIGSTRYDLRLPEDLGFEVLAPGSDVRIQKFDTWFETDPVTIRSVTRLTLDLPRHVWRARNLIEAALAYELRDEEVAEVALLDDPFLIVLLREMGDRIRVRLRPTDEPTLDGATERHQMGQAFRSTLDRILQARVTARTGSDQRSVARLLADIADREARFAVDDHSIFGPPFDLTLMYGPVRELSRLASSSELTDAILNGQAMAAMAAGLRREPECYTACHRLASAAIDLSRKEPFLSPEWNRKLACSAWAMLSIDAKRGAHDIVGLLLARGVEPAEGPLIPLLEYSGRPEIEPSLRSILRISKTGSVQDLIWQRCFKGLEVGLRPEEYWLGW